MLEAGCVILTVWLVLNLIPSAWIVMTTVFGDGHAPALTSILSVDEVDALSPAMLGDARFHRRPRQRHQLRLLLVGAACGLARALL